VIKQINYDDIINIQKKINYTQEYEILEIRGRV